MGGTHRTPVGIGTTWGMLTVTKPLRKNEHSQTMWEVRCRCGRLTYAWGYNLVKGKKSDCGCVRAGLADRKEDGREVLGRIAEAVKRIRDAEAVMLQAERRYRSEVAVAQRRGVDVPERHLLREYLEDHVSSEK